MVKMHRNCSDELYTYGTLDIVREVRPFEKGLTTEDEWQFQATGWYRMQCFRSSFHSKQDFPILVNDCLVVQIQEWVRQSDCGPYLDISVLHDLGQLSELLLGLNFISWGGKKG